MKRTIIDTFMEEHQKALSAIDRLAEAASKPDGLNTIQVFKESVAILNGEIREHNKREEEVLFPALERFLPPGGGPTFVMRMEHQQLWQFLDNLESALDDFEKNKREAYQNAIAICDLLSNHIQKENNILYPMALNMLSEDDLKEVHN